jgi:(p)ppGpp synthase/HD superfamily hydrolase/AAA+ ATPase superfamily predicted ATPase
MADANPHLDLTPWKPTPTQVSEEWMKLYEEFTQEAKGSQHAYVLKVRYDAQRVGNLLRSWGLPWQVVVAGYLWEYDKEQIRQANLEHVDEILSHISEADLYAKYIEDENLPPLLTPPYRDLGGLLIAIAIYYLALHALQEQSNEKTYTGAMQSQIESAGRTLLNIAKSLGMWHFKRDIEDLLEQLRSPRKFVELRKEHAHILEQDALMLEDTRQWLIKSYQQATGQPITVICIPCGIVGLKRRLQDAHTTATSPKTQLTGFDLVTFDVIVPTVQECYATFGVLSQLGYIQDDRLIEQIANPKPNGNSYMALGLILKPQGRYTQSLKWPETYTCICNLQIATPFMQAITWYGCLHPDCYQLHVGASLQEEIGPPSIEHLWNSEKGKVFLTLKEFLATHHPQPETKAPIFVYDNNRRTVALPKGATALDFAYALDSMIGDHAVEAFINNRQAPLYRILDAGDIVEIRMSSEVQTQDYWLSENYTVTSLARRQIKESLNRRFPYLRGYHLLHHILERYHFTLTKEELDRELRLLLKQHNLGTPQTYLKRLDKTGEPPYTPDWAAQQIMRQVAERNESLSAIGVRSSWIPVLDMDLTATKKFIHQQRLCNFCQPTYPRDMKIMGRLRKHSGELVVHKASCPHLIDRTKAQQSVLLPMTWQPQPPAFRVAFFVTAQDRKGSILDLARQLRRHQCDLISITAEAVSKFREARIHFTIEAYSDKEVLDTWQEVSRIENVTKVEIDASATSARIRDRLQKLRKQEMALPGKIPVELAWEESMVTLQPRNPILKNPFDISRPATAKMFFGRSAETKVMQRELCDGEQGKALMLYGPRRSGKSSICKNFLESQVRLPYWGVLFSLQNFIQHNEETILMQLAERISEEFREQLDLLAPDWQRYSNGDPQVRIKQVVQDCITKIPGSRLILALDEFGGVIESYEKGILEPRFFTFWKDLMNEIPQLSLVFALPTSAHNTLSSKSLGNTFSFVQPLPVMFLDTKSAEQLLIDPLRDQNVEIYPNTVALAVKLTGGNPYFMTLIGQQLIHHLNQETDKQLITDEDLRLVVEHLIEAGFNQNFIYLKRELQNNEELHILEAIVELTSRSNQAKVQLNKIAVWLNLPISVTRRHLERLRNGLILEENGPASNPYYSLTIELMRRWLVHNHWFFTPSKER